MGELVDPSGVAAALEVGGEERGDDLFGEPLADDTGTHRQHVGIVVGTGHPCGVEAVAQCGADASHLVGGELFTLTAAAENDAQVGVAVTHRATDAGTDLGIVDRLGRVRALVVDLVALHQQHRDEVLLQVVAGMVRTDCDASDAGGHIHADRVYVVATRAPDVSRARLLRMVPA